MSNLTTDDDGDSVVGSLTEKQQTEEEARGYRKATPGSIKRNTPRETPSERDSLNLDIGESPDDFIYTLNGDTEQHSQSRASRKERESIKVTPVNTEKLVNSRNVTQTSAKEKRDLKLDNEEKSELSKASLNAVTADQSKVSKASLSGEPEGRGRREGTDGREHRKPSADNFERSAKQASLGICISYISQSV